MSVVVGTSTGKVYLYSLKHQKITAVRGEAKRDNRVLGLDFLDAPGLGKKTGGQLDMVFANQKGELVLCPAEDELKTTGEQVSSQGLVAAQVAGRSVVCGSPQGELTLATISYDKSEDIYSVVDSRRIFEDVSLPGLSSLKLAGNSLTRLACLCQDRPPIVAISNKGPRCRTRPEVLGGKECACG